MCFWHWNKLIPSSNISSFNEFVMLRLFSFFNFSLHSCFSTIFIWHSLFNFFFNLEKFFNVSFGGFIIFLFLKFLLYPFNEISFLFNQWFWRRIKCPSHWSQFSYIDV